MAGWEIGFVKPWYLLLLLVIPAVWLLSFKSLSGLGRYRRLVAMSLRTLVLLLIILALSEVQLLQKSKKLTVIYLLDQSQSIPVDQREAMMEYVVRDVAKHRNIDRRDRAGLIVFGREAKIEVPPFDDDIPAVGVLDSFVDLNTDATNMEAALKLAQASFPEDASKRVVVVTDGNENIGDVRTVARMLAENEIGIDGVPIELDARSEIRVEKVAMPVDARKGQPLQTRVVISNDSREGKTVRGRLKLSRQDGSRTVLLNEDPASQLVDLKPGKNVFTFQHQIDQSAVYTFSAEFTPLDPQDDLMTQNNRASTFTHVRGEGRVLLIEDWENQGEFDYLADRLRRMKLEVTVQPSDQLFTSMAELQGYDTVILANVPRSSGSDASTVTNFSDAQIAMLVRNTQQLGCGLIMMGGPNSFGAGGWSNTELEKAMPVDFQIKNAKVQAVGALVLMMHASEMAQGNYWQKVTAREAIKALGPMDYCGLLHWSGTDNWLWGAPRGLVRISGRRKGMLGRLDRMTPGDMPQFDPGMRTALLAFNRCKASVKHMIIISDGDPSPPSRATLIRYKAAKIKVSTVAVGTHGPAGSNILQNIANVTGGKYYQVTNPKALPRIYQREARRVARPLIYEPAGGVTPGIVYPHEVLDGISEPLPRTAGFVMTSVKDNPLVEVAIRSPRPGSPKNATILATWTYGLGRTAVWTTDAGHRWANAWTEWESYDKLFSQLVRWSMRPTGDRGKFTVATNMKDGRVQVIVTALDENDEFLNFLNLSGTAIGPDLETFEVPIRQTAPGRYVGEFPADQQGSYFLNILAPPAAGSKDTRPQTLQAGVSVPYSAEFREQETNQALLTGLAALKPKQGKAGELIIGRMQRGQMSQLLETDTYRPDLAPAISAQDVWPQVMLFCACLFCADVFVRRVTIGFEWLSPLMLKIKERLGGGQVEPDDDGRLSRLRNQKAIISERLDERRSAARFEPQLEEQDALNLDEVLDDVGSAAPAPPPRPSAPSSAPSEEEESYTSRLLKAKKDAWKDKNNE